MQDNLNVYIQDRYSLKINIILLAKLIKINNENIKHILIFILIIFINFNKVIYINGYLMIM
jgi:hypothetical protein